MMRLIRSWVDEFFSDEEALFLLLLLVAGFVVVLTLGTILAPAIGSVILAYLLQAPLLALEKKGVAHLPASIAVFLLFIVLCLGFLLVIIPAVWSQMTRMPSSA